jgi:hypothetical protein
MAFKGKKAPDRKDDSVQSEFARRYRDNPFLFIGTVVILIIVIIAFVLAPAIAPEGGFGRGGDLTFGYYNKAPIEYVAGGYFARVQEAIAESQRSAINDSNYQEFNRQIWRNAFISAAIHTGILEEMKSAGYTAPASQVDREVAQLPVFQENGRFSTARYEAYDTNARLNLWREMRDEITKGHYISDITGLLKPSPETAFISRMASPRRSFEMTSFSVDAYPDSEVIAYAEENPGLFQSIHLSKITIKSSEGNARQVLNSIKEGTATFEEAATTRSEDGYAERGGDMGIKLAYELLPEAPAEEDREKILALQKGEYSDIVKVDSGWAFFRVEEAAVPADAGDGGTLGKIRSYMRTFERGRMEEWAIERAEEFIALARERGFEAALIEQSLEKRSFGPLAVNYGGVDLFSSLAAQGVNEIAGADTDEYFWSAAFSTPLNTPSAPLVQGGSVLVLFPLEEVEADETTIQNIESTLTSYWLSYNAEQGLQSYFLNSEKLVDQFYDAYRRVFPSQN